MNSGPVEWMVEGLCDAGGGLMANVAEFIHLTERVHSPSGRVRMSEFPSIRFWFTQSIIWASSTA